jgi:TetR/AcrR family transcriptional regulator, transcriptional repressor for nem operon
MTMQVEQTGTAAQILDVAERLVQTRGFNDFSYADIADELGITKPALHYHFRSKAVLGDAIIVRYSERFFSALERIESSESDAHARLKAYVQLYRSVLSERRMCLCGILAAEYQTLPVSMRSAVLDFFERNETWLERVLREGHDAHTLTVGEPIRDVARTIIDTLEGATMIARAQDAPERFDGVAARMLSVLVG